MKNALKALSLVLAVIVTVIVCRKSEDPIDVKRMIPAAECRLPVVYMIDGDLRYNSLFGYATRRDADIEVSDITVIPENRKLNIDIDRYNAEISDISYEIRSLDGKNLYEDNPAVDTVYNGATVRTVLPIKNLLDRDKDYMLIVKVKVKGFDEVYYYTRIRYDEGARPAYKAGLVKEFSDTTLDKSKVSTLTKYMETSDEMDNTDLGYVNIHSSIELLGYGAFSVSRLSGVEYRLKAVDKDMAVMELDYSLSAVCEGDTSVFDVREIFTIAESPRGMYLYGYERFVDERYTATGSVKSTSRIYLGIDSDKDVEYLMDEGEYYTAFVTDRELYMFDLHKNKLNHIFATAQGSGVRESHEGHDIKLISVSEKGDVRFALYGYMNSGVHEGLVGVSVYEYNYEKNDCTELMFIPYSCSYVTLMNHICDVFYVDDNKNISFINDKSLVNIDHDSREYTVIIEDLGDYGVNQRKDRVAYIKNNSLYIYDLKTQKEKEIISSEGDAARVLGYIENDIIYGVGKTADIYVDDHGKNVLPMGRLYILDEKYEVIKEYSPEDIYVTAGNIVGNRVYLNRVVKTEAGYRYKDTDQLMNRNDNQKARNDAIITVSAPKRLKEMALLLPSTVYDARTVTYNTTSHIYTEDEVPDAVGTFAADYRAYDIISARMHYLCTQNVKASTDVTETLKDYSSWETEDYSDYELIDCLGFVCVGRYIFAKDSEDDPVIICGYSKKGLNVYDIKSGTLRELTTDKIDDKLKLVKMGAD